MNYKIENGINFFTELKKELEKGLSGVDRIRYIT